MSLLAAICRWPGDALLMTAAAMGAASAGMLAPALGPPWRVGLWAVATGAGIAAALRVTARENAARLAWQRHLESMCEVDPAALAGDDLPAEVIPLAPGHPDAPLAARLGEALAACGRRIEHLEHRQAALEVRHRRAAVDAERVRAILAGMDDPVLAVDEAGHLVLANPAAAAVLALPDTRTEAAMFAEMVRCEQLVELLAVNARHAAAPRRAEIDLVDHEGRSRSFRATVGRLEAAGGAAAAGSVAVLRDIGEQKVLQKRNAEFVSAVSHEMKTPLSGIKAYVELLLDGDAEDEATREEFLQTIDSQADRLRRLVENLLNLARVEAGVVQVNKEPRSLNALLEEALRVVQPAAEAKQIPLVGDLSPMYLGVLADRDLLLQAAINLLSNAVKYTSEGGRVTLRSRFADGEVSFEVEDTGVGLSEEDCRQIFEKFYRVQKDKGMAQGTGLGLPLAKHIVEDVHGGKLLVRSRIGEGSCFSVVLRSAGGRIEE